MGSFFRNAKHIIEKYVDWEGEYAVNISSYTRENVLKSFEELCIWKDSLIQEKENSDENTTSSTATPPTQQSRASTKFGTGPTLKEDRKRAISKIMVVVDTGMQDVWHLLENDSFARFRCSKEFYEHQMSCNAANASNMPW